MKLAYLEVGKLRVSFKVEYQTPVTFPMPEDLSEPFQPRERKKRITDLPLRPLNFQSALEVADLRRPVDGVVLPPPCLLLLRLLSL